MRVWCIIQCRVFVVWNVSDAFDLTIRLAQAASLFSNQYSSIPLSLLMHCIVLLRNTKIIAHRALSPSPSLSLLPLSLFHTPTLFRHENRRPSVTLKSKPELNFDQSNNYCWLYVFIVCVYVYFFLKDPQGGGGGWTRRGWIPSRWVDIRTGQMITSSQWAVM